MTATKTQPGVHKPAKPKPCHCNPNPHHPCVHTVRSVAKKKAAAAKAKKTLAANNKKREAYTKAHPQQARLAALKAAAAPVHKPKPLTDAQKHAIAGKRRATIAKRTPAQVVAAKQRASVAAHKAATTRALNKAKGHGNTGPIKKSPKPVLLPLPKKAAKHRVTNPHHKPATKTKAKKC